MTDEELARLQTKVNQAQARMEAAQDQQLRTARLFAKARDEKKNADLPGLAVACKSSAEAVAFSVKEYQRISDDTVRKLQLSIDAKKAVMSIRGNA